MLNKGAKRIIATNWLNYLCKRNFFDLELDAYEFEKQTDCCKVLAFLYFKSVGSPHPILHHIHCGLGFIPRFDLFHGINTISVGSKPWVTTFEFQLPRWNTSKFNKHSVSWALKRLASDSCKTIIAMSDFAYRAQAKFLEKFPDLAPTILGKMTTIHPSQQPIISHYEQKPLSSDFVTFTLVGSEFFRKGGGLVLRVFDRLIRKGASIKLNIVSSLAYGDYASKAEKMDYDEAKQIVATHPSHINHYPIMTSNEVLDLFIRTDVGLLPSFDETYGFSVLEAQACGCPVITTSGGAFREINNEKVGWIIDVPVAEDGRSIPRTLARRTVFVEEVEAGLERIVVDVCNNRDLVRLRGMAALNRVIKEHGSTSRGELLRAIYDSALGE